MTTEAYTILWNAEKPVTDYGVSVPKWIEQDITTTDVMAITEGGCESGAYMPAVTYHTANDTMSKYGDEVLEYLEDSLGELPEPKKGESWSGLACFYLSCAVEMWATLAADELVEKLEETEA